MKRPLGIDSLFDSNCDILFSNSDIFFSSAFTIEVKSKASKNIIEYVGKNTWYTIRYKDPSNIELTDQNSLIHFY